MILDKRNRFERGHKAWDEGQLRSAFHLFLLGAKSGDSSCQQNLGYFYDEGIGVKKSASKAIRWYELAAQGGSLAAAYNLAVKARELGDLSAVKHWLSRAAELGDQDAQAELTKPRD